MTSDYLDHNKILVIPQLPSLLHIHAPLYINMKYVKTDAIQYIKFHGVQIYAQRFRMLFIFTTFYTHARAVLLARADLL